MGDIGCRLRLDRFADLERRYDGAAPATLLRGALHGARYRLFHAAAQSRLFDRLAGSAVAAIARQRREAAVAVASDRLVALMADLRFCRKHGLVWNRRAREHRSGG